MGVVRDVEIGGTTYAPDPPAGGRRLGLVIDRHDRELLDPQIPLHLQRWVSLRTKGKVTVGHAFEYEQHGQLDLLRPGILS